MSDMAMTAEEIEGCSDIETLKDNYLDCFEAVEDIKIQIECFRFAGIAEDSWLKRAVSALIANKMSMVRSERRLLEIGSRPDYPMTDPRTREVGRLNNKLREVNARLAKYETVN